MHPKTIHGVQARSIRELDLTRANAPLKIYRANITGTATATVGNMEYSCLAFFVSKDIDFRMKSTVSTSQTGDTWRYFRHYAHQTTLKLNWESEDGVKVANVERK